ncbi:MAG: response regulator [Proteobacteria bacterium]|nr:MAG: response regulator [Pseudomonadota bacterium]
MIRTALNDCVHGFADGFGPSGLRNIANRLRSKTGSCPMNCALLNKQILLVEDDDDIRESMEEALALEGYEVISAQNGKIALSLIERGLKPDMILLDLMMPVMNGIEFLEHYTSPTFTTNAPVVVVSATINRAAQCKASRLLKKPVNLDDLFDTVSSLLKHPENQRA